MNCKPKSYNDCETCREKMLCRAFLGLKELNEYSNKEPVKYPAGMDWNNELPIIATAKRNPLLGIEIDTNVKWSTIPDDIKNSISLWAHGTGNEKLRKIVDAVGIIRTFGGDKNGKM